MNVAPDLPERHAELDARDGTTGVQEGRGLALGWLLAPLFVLASVQNILLWRFLDFAEPWLYVAGAALTALLGYLVVRPAPLTTLRVSPSALAICGAVSLLLCVLGGEGRFLYANYDWQVRDAVLHDLRLNSWPFVYALDGVPGVLRAPIAMYLVPALIGKVAGPWAAEVALLMQNSAILALILAAAATLFDRARARGIALAVFVAFSGLDIIGRAIVWVVVPSRPLSDHIETWADIQFSSHITQIFWVPQHAFAGWLCALLYLLWSRRMIGVGAFLGAVPLMALLSPLAIIGIVPFAAHAGLSSLFQRRLRAVDFIIPGVALAISIPALVYLSAGSSAVGFRLMSPGIRYPIFIMIEVAGYLLAVAIVLRPRGQDRTLLALTGLCLLAAPFGSIGEGLDFIMRASIPALAFLAFLVARTVTGRDRENWIGRRLVVGLLAIGSITGALEISRSLLNRPTPRVDCSLVEVGGQVVGLVNSTIATYVIPATDLPEWLRPIGPAQAPRSGRPCWSRDWRAPRLSAPSLPQSANFGPYQWINKPGRAKA